MQDQVVAGSRIRAARNAVLSVVFSAGCGWLLTLPNLSLKGQFAGWVGTPFFAVAAVAWAVRAVKGR